MGVCRNGFFVPLSAPNGALLFVKGKINSISKGSYLIVSDVLEKVKDQKPSDYRVNKLISEQECIENLRFKVQTLLDKVFKQSSSCFVCMMYIDIQKTKHILLVALHT